MRPHLLILYQHYRSPDCPANARVRSLLRTLRPHAEITLITSDAWRKSRQTDHFSWFPNGIDAIEVSVPYANRMTTPQRIWSYSSFALQALWHGVRHTDPDLVYGISTPLSTAGTAALVARQHGVPWIFELHDLWPSFPIQMGAVPFEWLQLALYRWERALYESAVQIVTMSPDMTAHVENTGPSADRVTTVLPGSEPEFLNSPSAPAPDHLRRKHELPDTPLVLYAGTFGRANDIPSLINAARRCADASFSFVFVGRGFYEPHLRRLADRQPSVHLISPQPQHHMGSWYDLADLSLVPFLDRPVLAANSPAKFFDSLTMGTPVLVTNPGWTRTFVETHGCGWYIPPSQPSALAQKLRALMAAPSELHHAGAQGQEVARSHFNRSHRYTQISSMVQRVLSSKSTNT